MELDRMQQSVDPDHPVILMIDANARVGSETSSAIGPLGAQNQDASGALAPAPQQALHDGSVFLRRVPRR